VPILAQAFAYGATEDRNFVGYFTAPEEIVEPLPGIVLVHERWGLDDSIKSLARDLAGAGYAVMAVDLFGGATAADPAGAQVLVDAATADREGLLNNIAQAIDYLRAYALAPRVAVVGFGLGGGLALETAVTSPEKIDAVVNYYGRLIFDEAELARLRAPLLGLYADRDESVPVRDVQSFRRLLRELGNDSDVFLYLNVPHGFADPGRATFDPQAAGEAWQELIDFLGTTLGRG
jgi:carboxymethylenebutenolidase